MEDYKNNFKEDHLKNCNINLQDLEIIEKILLSGSPQEIEDLKNFYNLNKDQIEMFRFFVKMSNAVHLQMRENFKKRILINPEPTEEEWEMGVYIEEIEPQVIEAVRIMRKKGYDTYESGFYGPEKQRIGLRGEELKGVVLSQDIIKIARERED
ncbi:MAG: hypothetical protein QXO70_03075 [Candidatus Pacearchaeota archaeon]